MSTALEEMSKAMEEMWQKIEDEFILNLMYPERVLQNRVNTTFSNCTPCNYFSLDGGPSPVMCCNHPKTTEDYGYIISWTSDRTKRTSDKCPKKCKETI